jgi:hypothetical protein
LETVPTDSVQQLRDRALLSVFFLTSCRVSAVVGTCVGQLVTNGVERYLCGTKKRNRKRRKILLDVARLVLASALQTPPKKNKFAAITTTAPAGGALPGEGERQRRRGRGFGGQVVTTGAIGPSKGQVGRVCGDPD